MHPFKIVGHASKKLIKGRNHFNKCPVVPTPAERVYNVMETFRVFLVFTGYDLLNGLPE